MIKDEEINRAQEAFDEKTWPDPQPLHIELKPVLPMREEMLPGPLRPWIIDEAYRMQKAPLDFVAVPAICMVGAVIGAGCGIWPKRLDNWMVVSNTWGGIIARPGKKKTPAINAAFAPLWELEREAAKKFHAERSRRDAALTVFEAKRKAAKARIEKATRLGHDTDELEKAYAGIEYPSLPPEKRFITNDATVEALGEMLQSNPRGLCNLQDELIKLFYHLDKEENKEARCIHLQAWNGHGRHLSDRVVRGRITVPHLCETIFGGTQPSKFHRYLHAARNNIENDGLLQRFPAMVYPNEVKGTPVDERADEGARKRAFDAVRELAEMDFVAFGAVIDQATKVPCFHFTPEAQDFFNEWYMDLDGRLQNDDDDPIMLEHLSKFPKLMPGLALKFFLLEVADTGKTRAGVPLHCAELAAEWCAYFESHARRIYGLMMNAAVQGARRLLTKIKGGVVQNAFQARDVYNQSWAFLDSKESVKAVAGELIELGWLREVQTGTMPSAKGGRPPAPTYLIHPKAREILQGDGERDE